MVKLMDEGELTFEGLTFEDLVRAIGEQFSIVDRVGEPDEDKLFDEFKRTLARKIYYSMRGVTPGVSSGVVV